MHSIDLAHVARHGSVWLALAAMSACTSVSLEPRPVARQQPAAQASQPLPRPAHPAPSAPAAAPAPVAQSGPVTMPPSAAPAEPAAAPYGPAVAARFPDPSVTFGTPAFAPGHSGFTTNAELHAWLAGLAAASGRRIGGPDVRLLELGSSQMGTPLEALLFARRDAGAGSLAPGGLAEGLVAGRPTVLLIGQQHGDEPAGSEALLVIAQELANGTLESLLDRINVVVLARANPDGAEANRRTTASGIDANRDHLLLKTPEAQAQALLVREFAPAVVVDAHEYTVVGRYLEKFGTVQRFDVLLQYAMTANIPPFTTKASEEWFRQPAVASLKGAGLSSEWYYTTSTDVADKKISMGGTQPDTGRNVDGLTNAISILIETRGVGLGRLHFKRRVWTQVTAITSILQSAAARSADLAKLRQYVDHEVSALACQGDVVVEAGPTPSEYRLLMLDPATGADKAVTVAWDSALELRPLTIRARPCGYWLAREEADAVQHLRALGVQVLRLDQDAEVRGETYRETMHESSQRQDVRGPLYDAGGVVQVKVQLVPSLVDMRAGSFYVPLDQPLGNLIVAALEPDTQNSFFANRLITSSAGEARLMARPELQGTSVP